MQKITTAPSDYTQTVLAVYNLPQHKRAALYRKMQAFCTAEEVTQLQTAVACLDCLSNQHAWKDVKAAMAAAFYEYFKGKTK